MDALRSEIADALSGVLSQSERNVEMVMMRLGLLGGHPRTLEEVGDVFGLTRERVRQVEARARGRLAQRAQQAFPGLAFPVLDFALQIAHSICPCSQEALNTTLREQGITQDGVSPLALIRTAEFLDVPVEFKAVRTAHGEVIATHGADGDVADRALSCARRLIGSHGTLTVAEVAATITEDDSRPQDQGRVERYVRASLELARDVHWLDSEHEWFWISGLSTRKNRLVNDISRVLSVCGQISATELRAAVRRDYRLGYAPPTPVLLALADLLPSLVRDGETIRPARPIDRAEALGNMEYIICDVLEANGAVMARPSLQAACVARGVSTSSFFVRLSYSPAIRRYGPGVYGLAGHKFEPGLVERLVPRAKKSRLVQGSGFTGDSRIWVTYKVNETLIASGVVSIPGLLKEFLQGEFRLDDAAGNTMGRLAVKNWSAWGLGPFFRRRGAEPGDTLLLVFDPRSRSVACHLGDETVCEEVLGD